MNTARTYFEHMYADDPDPWGFATSWYESRKYALTVASLPEARYRSAFEPGCAIGMLTTALATRCDRLLATEIVPVALEQARRRLRALPNVRILAAAIPEDWPEGTFDLVVLSEIAYYFDEATLSDISERATASLSEDGTLVGVHWRGATDYPLTGDAAQAIIGAARGLDHIVEHREDAFALDVWRKAP